MNIPRKPFKFIGELTGYQKVYPSLCLRRLARAPLPSYWLRSFLECVIRHQGRTTKVSSSSLQHKSALGVDPKAPTPIQSQSFCYAGEACMDGSK